jgi:hypothetical protein
VKLPLQHGEKKFHTEYWFPTDRELNIYEIKMPVNVLRPLSEVPLFGWARPNVWMALENAYRKKTPVPDPPQTLELNWPPSGMDNLDAAFQWAIAVTQGSNTNLWKFYYGAWLAGRDNTVDNAIPVLQSSNLGEAKVLLARILASKKDMTGARKAIEAVRTLWLQIHPQVIIERDKILRSFGASTLSEREQWLSKVAALTDEWIIERRVQLLIDKGQFQQAKDLLLTTPFQKVHQTYTRTALWMQLCKKLNIECFPIPQQLGEDRLATFGAYREFEEEKN